MVKSKYETEVLPKLGLVEAWAREGLAERQIARNLGISMSTLGAYKQRHEDLREALERGKELVDLEVENDLLKKCRGYNAPVKKTYKLREIEYDPETGKRVREYERLEPAYDEVHVSADLSAIQFWLSNRRPDRWQYKPEGRRQEEDEDEGSGVVVLTPVMEAPDPPEEESGHGDG